MEVSVLNHIGQMHALLCPTRQLPDELRFRCRVTLADHRDLVHWRPRDLQNVVYVIYALIIIWIDFKAYPGSYLPRLAGCNATTVCCSWSFTIGTWTTDRQYATHNNSHVQHHTPHAMRVNNCRCKRPVSHRLIRVLR